MNEREIAFLRELKEILTRYEVELTSEDHYPGYPECGEDIRIEAYASSDYSVDEEGLGINLDFGRCVDVNKIQEMIDAQT